MHIAVNEQNLITKDHFYNGEGTVEFRAAIGFGGVPSAEGSRVMSSMRMTIPAGASVGTHVHKNAEELYVVLSGKGLHTSAGEEYEIHPGDVIHTKNGVEHSVTPQGDEALVLQAALIESLPDK